MASPTMGMRAPLFLAIWVIMMVAMMFPTAAPMILTFHKVQASKRQRGEAFVATWMFVAAYMLVWTLSGVAAYAGALAAEAIATRAALSPATAARIGGAVLVAAGLYQLTPFKDLCLSKCRTPISFIMTSWRDGRGGRAAHGIAPWRLLPWLLLAAVRYPVSARHHEHRRHGGYHARDLRREDTALGSRGRSRHGRRTHSLWFGGSGGAPTPADILREPRHGHARRHADEDA